MAGDDKKNSVTSCEGRYSAEKGLGGGRRIKGEHRSNKEKGRGETTGNNSGKRLALKGENGCGRGGKSQYKTGGDLRNRGKEKKRENAQTASARDAKGANKL